MIDIAVDVPDSLWLQENLGEYAGPKARIARLVDKGALYRLKKGVYVRSERAGDVLVRCKAANRLYGPSYVSFVYALRWYGLIPEHVEHITSATFKKGKKKRYDTPIGSFFYQDVPARAYPHGVRLVGEGEGRFLMASPEKALCDSLYRISNVRSLKAMETLLFEDLRVDEELFAGLDHGEVRTLAGYYQTVTLRTFARMLGGNHDA